MHARGGRDHGPVRPAPRGVARAPTSARTFRPATTSVSWRTRWSTADPTAVVGSIIDAGDNHPLAARRAGVWEVADVADRITLEVARYRPDAGGGAHLPVVRGALPQGLGRPRRAQLHQGPHRRDAVLSLVLPHGRVRQLRHDRQRRAQAHLRHLPDRLRAGPGAGRAAAQLPGHPRPGRRHRRLHGKLATVKPWIVRKAEKPIAEGEYRQTPAQLDEYKQYSMCINCMLCYSACPVYGLDPQFIGPAAIALAQRYNLDSRDEGAQPAPRHPVPSTRGSGAAPSWASAPRCARNTSTRPGRSSATS